MLKGRWAVDDLRDLPDDGNRYEVIDGELFVTPAPTWKHQEATAALYREIAEYLLIHRVGHAVFAPADVVFSAKRGVQPDLFVVPLVDGRRPERFADVGRLLLAVEVLSPSTARADRVAKRVLYRDQGVEQYWMVDPESRILERSIPTDSRVEVLADTIEWLPEGATDALAIDLPDYFRRVLDG
jgi:Uma2 family endonuclease